LKKDDFPTFGSPAGSEMCPLTRNKERTDDANLEVIAGTAKEDFLLLNWCLFRWHPFFDRAEGWRRDRKGSTRERENDW